MTSSGDTSYLDLVQTTQAGEKVRDTIKSLIPYFSIGSIPAAQGVSKVKCSPSERNILHAVREAFMEEFVRSKKVVVNPLRKTYADWLMHGRLPTL